MEIDLSTGLLEAATVAARWLYAVLFAAAGYNHLKNREAAARYAASNGVPAPLVATVASGLVWIGGAAAVASGYLADVGALAIAATLAVTTAYFHRQPEEREKLTRNLTLIGASLMMFAGDVAGLFERWSVNTGLFQVS